MSASFVAGFLMVVVAFIFSAWKEPHQLTGDTFKDVIVLVAIAFNILFFYSFGLVSEHNSEFNKFIRSKGNVEWWLRVTSNVLLLALPLTHEMGVPIFCFTLIAFYVSLLTWDVIVFSRDPQKYSDGRSMPNPMYFDIGGLIASVLLVGALLMYRAEESGAVPEHIQNTIDPNRLAMLLGMITVGYGAMAVLSAVKAFPEFQEALKAPRI